MFTPSKFSQVVPQIFAFLCVGLLGVACKKTKEGNESRSIQAILEAKIGERNADACGMPPADPEGNANKTEAVQSVAGDGKVAKARVYGALPQLFKAFKEGVPAFLPIESINLSDDIAADCAGLLDRNKEACWKPTSDKKIQVVVANNPAAVHRGLLPMAAYAFFEGYRQLVGDDLRKQIAAHEVSEAEGKKVKDGLALLDDQIAAITQAALTDMLSPTPDAVLNATLGKQAIANLAAMLEVANDENLKAHSKVQNFLLAEMTDSYYCSKISHDSFSTGLKTAFTAFHLAFGREVKDGGMGNTWFP